MSVDFLGIWAYPEKNYDAFLHFAPDGRTVLFIRHTERSTQVIPMKHWYVNEGSDQFRIRSMPGAIGYVITMRCDGNTLIIQNNQTKTQCRRVSADEAPPWFATELAKAHEKMAELERTQGAP